MDTTAAYLRISSDKQDTQRQRESLAKFEPALWFEDSEGKNPRDQAAKRKGFQALFKAVESGLVQRIVVDRQDRFGVKDAYEFGKFISLLRDHNCELIDSSGKVLSSNDDVSVLTGTLGAITSRREQVEKGHRSISAKVQRAKAGEYPGGYPPYGLDVVCVHNGKERFRVVWVGHFERLKIQGDTRESFVGKNNMPAKDQGDTYRYRPNPERAKVVKQIFTWYADGTSPGQIATRLNKTGVDAIFGVWNKVKVTSILRNPIYIGLPTYNKRGAARFAEYVGGSIREASGKSGRRRAASDQIQPDKPEFRPIVPQTLWARVQTRLSDSKQGPRSSAKTADLWLRPLLVCFKCQKTMHSMTGGRVWPSYFCSTYNTHGKDNPTGCRCHKVRHSVLEAIVLKYLDEVKPDVRRLLDSFETGEIPQSDLTDLRQAVQGLACDMLTFVGEAPGPLVNTYEELYRRALPELQAAIAAKESEIESLIDSYATLPNNVRHRTANRIGALQTELEGLQAKAVDLRVPYEQLRQQLQDRERAIGEAITTIRSEAASRRKTEALRAVVERIVLYFRYTERKSHLDRVEIVAGGDTWSYKGASPGQSIRLSPLLVRWLSRTIS